MRRSRRQTSCTLISAPKTPTGRRCTRTGSSSATTRCSGSGWPSANSTASWPRKSSRRAAATRSPARAGLFLFALQLLLARLQLTLDLLHRVDFVLLLLLRQVESLGRIDRRPLVGRQFNPHLVDVDLLFLLEGIRHQSGERDDEPDHDELDEDERHRAPIDLLDGHLGDRLTGDAIDVILVCRDA